MPRPKRVAKLEATAALSRSGWGQAPILVPKRWVKLIAGILLLPVAWVLSSTFFNEFARVAVGRSFWATEEFYFFALGAVLWCIAFFGLPRTLWLYVFGHELTHAVWVWLMGGRVTEFK